MPARTALVLALISSALGLATGAGCGRSEGGLRDTGVPDTATGGIGDEGVTSETSVDAPAALLLDVSTRTFERQPMVAELVFDQPGLSVEVVDEGDPGVRAAACPGAPPLGQTCVRVRGLAPGTSHTLRYVARAADGREASAQLLLITEPPLPGFRASFPVEGVGPGPAGYILFDLGDQGDEPLASLFVIDGEGVTRWHISRSDGVLGPAAVFAGASLEANGDVLFLRDHALEVVDELGDTQERWSAAALGLPGLHHDVRRLPNGNLVALSYAFREVTYAGLGPTLVAGDLIVEVDPTGAVVWTWDTFDHLDPQRRRQGFALSIWDPTREEFARDWTHGNGLVHDVAGDKLLFSMRHQDWVVQIDHATGALDWRLGEGGDFTLGGGTWHYHQHSPEWQADGSLLLYDNGVGNPNLADDLERSRVLRFTLDRTTMTATPVWQDAADPFVSPIAGDADRLADGRILVTDSSLDFGPGTVRARLRVVAESDGSTRWSLSTPAPTFIYRGAPIARLPGEPAPGD